MIRIILGSLLLAVVVIVCIILSVLVAGVDYSRWFYMALHITGIVFLFACGVVIGAMLIESGQRALRGE